MLTAWPKNFPGLGIGAEKLAKIITRMSDGRLNIKLFSAGELVPAFEVFQAVSNGTAEMGHTSPYYWKGKVPEAQFFSTVPFGLTATEISGWIHYGDGQKLWDKLYAPFSLQAFACGNTGVQMGGWYNRPIKNWNSFKGLKVRMPGLGGEVLRRAGAVVVSLPGGEIFQALQSGTIDATEWVGPYNDLAFGFYKVAKHYYWPGWHEPGTVLELLVSKKKFQELPKDLQEIVRVACRGAYEDMMAEFITRNNTALLQLQKKHKVKLSRFPNDFLKKAGKVSKEVVSELGNQSKLGKEIYQSYTKFRNSSIPWTHIAEESFSAARRLLN